MLSEGVKLARLRSSVSNIIKKELISRMRPRSGRMGEVGSSAKAIPPSKNEKSVKNKSDFAKFLGKQRITMTIPTMIFAIGAERKRMQDARTAYDPPSAPAARMRANFMRHENRETSHSSRESSRKLSRKMISMYTVISFAPFLGTV